MDAWKGGWLGKWVAGWMDGWVGGLVDKWMDWWMDFWVHGWVDGWVGGRMERWMDGMVCRSMARWGKHEWDYHGLAEDNTAERVRRKTWFWVGRISLYSGTVLGGMNE
jgi:hypothetical protein